MHVDQYHPCSTHEVSLDIAKIQARFAATIQRANTEATSAKTLTKAELAALRNTDAAVADFIALYFAEAYKNSPKGPTIEEVNTVVSAWIAQKAAATGVSDDFETGDQDALSNDVLGSAMMQVLSAEDDRVAVERANTNLASAQRAEAQATDELRRLNQQFGIPPDSSSTPKPHGADQGWNELKALNAAVGIPESDPIDLKAANKPFNDALKNKQ